LSAFEAVLQSLVAFEKGIVFQKWLSARMAALDSCGATSAQNCIAQLYRRVRGNSASLAFRLFLLAPVANFEIQAGIINEAAGNWFSAEAAALELGVAGRAIIAPVYINDGCGQLAALVADNN
jgi:hypothetical protein